MTGQPDEHERTLRVAETALSHIKALRQDAEPRSYELWYHYVIGDNPSLNERINATLSARGTLTNADIEDIHSTFISPARLADRIDAANCQIVSEIDQIMTLVESSLGSATRHSENLTDMMARLGQTSDRDGLLKIVQMLVQTADLMKRDNQALETRLNASKQEIVHLQRNLETVRTESLTDPLTTLANRKYFDIAIAKAITDATANSEPMSLILTDIDHFKSFNDTYGHLTGDQVLRLVAISLKQNVKGQDTAARYGGEEFAVVLPKTALRQAMALADHIRCAVMGKELMKRSTGEHLGRLTLSMGVASLRRGDTATSLIQRADMCLYAAKRNGRNRVVCEADPEFITAQNQVA